MRAHAILLAGLLLAPAATAQLTDLQPGRNFPNAVVSLGAGVSGNAALGDIDHDGDLDVAVAEGSDGIAEANRIYVNVGGAQGGTPGSFADETATRFAGAVADHSRNVHFVDWDGDCDLDLYFANDGSTSTGGEPSRAHVNRGGLQHGQVGFFSEITDSFWGSLANVPVAQQIAGGDQGPFRDYCCDCDFGDLDLDGDPDLFFASYGPNISGSTDSRVFLNDGTGRFDELWPWAAPGTDITLGTADVDLADLDGDMDLDVVASNLKGQARIYRNDLDVATGTWGPTVFTDLTQSAFVDTGATVSSNANYEVECGDADGDGDFDLWMMNYAGFADRLLINDGDAAFTNDPSLIKGDPSQDDEECDFLDYDSDGDLDLLVANFSGTNWIYQNGLADGVDPGLGRFHRTGTSSGGSLADWPETPASQNAGTSEGGLCADLDGDGDPDVLILNNGGQNNRVWENVLGVPDTHAPVVLLLTAQDDKTDGSDTPIRAQLRDNAESYVVGLYAVDLLYRVDGGLENRVRMRSQGSMQFQTTLPGGLDGTISYRVEGQDDAGNSFTSAELSYVQGSSGVTLLQTVGEGTLGTQGRPDLELWGAFTGGADVDLSLCDAAPSATCLLLFSLSSTPLSFKGGLLHTVPVAAELLLNTDAGGQLWIDATWPAGVPAGAQLWQQCVIADASATGGAALSNAVLLTAP